MVSRPDFLVIGAQKAGTTNLWNMLGEHPDVAMHRRKELHYFLRHTDYPDHEWYRKEFEQDGRLTGEATPSYCFWPGAIERIERFDPEIKLIMILRDPVYRAISQYWMEFNAGHETLPIGVAMVPIEHRESADHARGIQHSLYHHSYLWRGLYYAQLREVFVFFPMDQVHVLILEHLIKDPVAVMRGTANFLGIVPVWNFDSEFARRKGSYIPPAPALVNRLADYFRRSNQLLEKTYDIDTSEWL